MADSGEVAVFICCPNSGVEGSKQNLGPVCLKVKVRYTGANDVGNDLGDPRETSLPQPELGPLAPLQSGYIFEHAVRPLILLGS